MIKHLKKIPVSVWLLFAAALLIRAFHLSQILLYWDEPIHSVRIDGQPMAFVLAHNNGSALFAVLVHFLLPLGKIELMSRLPSFVFGSLLVPLAYAAGRAFFSRREGTAAAALAAFSPFLIRFSQYSRGYSVFVFFTLLTLLLMYRARATGRIALWAGYAGSAAAAMYTHLMGFMAVSGPAVFSAVEWIAALFRRERRAEGTRRLLLFGLFSLIAASAAVLLYLPDQNVRGFLTSSVDRVESRPPFGYLAAYLADLIMTTQWHASAWGWGLWLVCLGIGLAATLRRKPADAFLLIAYAAVPFWLFIRVNPREVNIQSADRYFIFILPVFILLAARGITAFAGAAASAVARIRRFAIPPKRAAAVFTLAGAAAVLAGADLGHYYLNFHRFNTLKVPGEVENCLRSNLEADALLLYDRFPAPGLRLVLNPLTRDPGVRGSEEELRAGFSAPPGGRIMIYRSVTDPAELYPRPFGVWAVTDRTPEKKARIESLQAEGRGFRFFPLKEFLVLHYQPEGGTLGDRVIDACTLLLKTDPAPVRRREWLLLRARAFLIAGRTAPGLADLDAARDCPVSGNLHPGEKVPFVFRILDALFRLDSQKVTSAYLDYFHHRDTAEVLFSLGEKILAAGDHATAARIFREIPLWSPHLDRAVSIRLGRIASTSMRRKDHLGAASLFAEATRLDPDRLALACLEAEALRASGDGPAARAQWRTALGWASPPSGALDLLVSDRPLLILTRREDVWRIVLRSPKKALFSGRDAADRGIISASGDLFAAGDALDFNRERLDFTVESEANRIKIISI